MDGPPPPLSDRELRPCPSLGPAIHHRARLIPCPRADPLGTPPRVAGAILLGARQGSRDVQILARAGRIECKILPKCSTYQWGD